MATKLTNCLFCELWKYIPKIPLSDVFVLYLYHVKIVLSMLMKEQKKKKTKQAFVIFRLTLYV